MTEADRQKRITDALDLFGWQWVWYRPAQTGRGWRTPLSGKKGAPDIWAAHEGRGELLAVEVKSDKGKLAREQADWRDALVAAMRGATGFTYWLCDSQESEDALLRVISGGKIQ